MICHHNHTNIGFSLLLHFTCTLQLVFHHRFDADTKTNTKPNPKCRYYVNDVPQLKTEPAGFRNYIQDVKGVAPPTLPLIDWETGASTNNLTEAEQAQWAVYMMDTAQEEGLLGFNWWQWVDWAPHVAKCVFVVF